MKIEKKTNIAKIESIFGHCDILIKVACRVRVAYLKE